MSSAALASLRRPLRSACKRRTNAEEMLIKRPFIAFLDALLVRGNLPDAPHHLPPPILLLL